MHSPFIETSMYQWISIFHFFYPMMAEIERNVNKNLQFLDINMEKNETIYANRNKISNKITEICISESLYQETLN